MMFDLGIIAPPRIVGRTWHVRVRRFWVHVSRRSGRVICVYSAREDS
jgi:hypothetical protein